MAFDGLCFDLMEFVGQLVEAKRLDSCTAFWTHNGSTWRLVNNQFNNTVDALDRRGKSITPSLCAKPYKYVQKSWNWRRQLNSGCRLPTPQWGIVPRGGCLVHLGGKRMLARGAAQRPKPYWLYLDKEKTYGTLAAYIKRLALDPVAYATWGNARKHAMLYNRPYTTKPL